MKPTAKTIGFIGLGKMGMGMVEHLKEQGVEVVSFNRSPHALATVKTIGELLAGLTPPRIVWLMVSSPGVDEVLGELGGLTSGDIIIDGGNSFYKDTVRRNAAFGKRGITYLDCGVSGGLQGARNGACLMIGGDEAVVTQLEWLWNALAVEDGWKYVGPSGAGHFVKMVHNGVEYGMDQAIAEEFAIMEKSPYRFDLAAVADLWNHGSVVRSWLIELLAKELTVDPRLDKLIGRVGGGETGQQALDTAKELGVEAEVLEESIEARKKSQTNPTFATKVVSALRKQYGGHTESKVT